MTHPFHQYLATQLDRILRDERVVVFYDPRNEFAPFIDELDVVGTGLGDLPRVCVQDTLAHLARYEGSFFALKTAVEPVVCLDRPEPLLIYVPGQAWDRDGSVLMELDKAGKDGHPYQPQLRRLAINVLRRKFTDGDIDEMLAPESLTYQDVVGYLGQAGDGQASLVKLILGEGSSEAILTRWLASDAWDHALEAKQATGELFKLIHARLGLNITDDTALIKARHQTLRYLLTNEFRADLSCPPPSSLTFVPAPSTREEQQRVYEIVQLLRKDHGEAYADVADRVEKELDCEALGIDPACLGSIDTFRFEERALLRYGAELVEDAHYQKALDVVAARGRSFWVDRDLGRLAQWEACRLMAELGLWIHRVRPLVKKMSGPAHAWVEAYTAEDGWFQADRAHRCLETWVARMEEEPEEPLEKALHLVRRNHDALLAEMARGFTRSLKDGGWSISGPLHQTRIYPELVSSAGGRVAYFFVDALRFEMGADLAGQLEGAMDLRLVPAVVALPSITPVGMAALLPGAAASFSVMEHKGKLAARIGDSVMPTLTERMKYLRAVRPDAQDLDLGELLQKSVAALKKKLGAAPLIIVRSQAIDGLGELDGGLLARQIMDTVVGNLARAVRTLAKLANCTVSLGVQSSGRRSSGGAA